jgi:hypothetical protein
MKEVFQYVADSTQAVVDRCKSSKHPALLESKVSESRRVLEALPVAELFNALPRRLLMRACSLLAL